MGLLWWYRRNQEKRKSSITSVGIIVHFKLYHGSELPFCLAPDPSTCTCHYSGISSCCTPLLLHYLLLSKVWGWERTLRSQGSFFLSLFTLSWLTICTFIHIFTMCLFILQTLGTMLRPSKYNCSCTNHKCLPKFTLLSHISWRQSLLMLTQTTSLNISSDT